MRREVGFALIAIAAGVYFVAGQRVQLGTPGGVPVPVAEAPRVQKAVPSAPAATAPTPAPAPKAAPAPVAKPVAPPAPSPAPAAVPAPKPSAAAAAAPTPGDEQKWRVRLNEGDADTGPADALATVVYFSAFGCDQCREMAEGVKTIKEKYGKDVRVVFKHKILPPSPYALEASIAALAAGEQGKFWEYHDVLFANAPAFDQGSLEQYAQQVKLNLKKFKNDMQNDKLRGMVLKDTLLANEIGAHSMPNVLVNGVRMKGAKSMDNLMPLVDREVEKAKKLVAAGTKRDEIYTKAITGGKFFEQLAPKKNLLTTATSAKKGPDTAKVKIYTFEDFQCPFCATVGMALKDFQALFPNDVQLIFKQFPLRSIHPEAQLAGKHPSRPWNKVSFGNTTTSFCKPESCSGKTSKFSRSRIGLDMVKFRAALDSEAQSSDRNRYAGRLSGGSQRYSRCVHERTEISGASWIPA